MQFSPTLTLVWSIDFKVIKLAASRSNGLILVPSPPISPHLVCQLLRLFHFGQHQQLLASSLIDFASHLLLHSDHITRWEMAPLDAASPSAAPAVAPASLIEAIVAATTYGQWGDVCFVVKLSSGDFAYVPFWAKLTVLRAHGAGFLADRIVQSSYGSLDDAIAALRSSTGSQSRALTSTNQISNGQRRIYYFAVSNICATTMRAILVYLQTGHIEFAPITSSISDTEADDCDDDASLETFVDVVQEPMPQARGSVAHAHVSTSGATSPKSVYRAARKYRLAGLCELASIVIDQQITPQNCLAELFGGFSLKNPEVFEKRLTYVLQHWNDIEERTQLVPLLNNTRHRLQAMNAFNAIMAHTSIDKDFFP